MESHKIHVPNHQPVKNKNDNIVYSIYVRMINPILRSIYVLRSKYVTVMSNSIPNIQGFWPLLNIKINSCWATNHHGFHSYPIFDHHFSSLKNPCFPAGRRQTPRHAIPPHGHRYASRIARDGLRNSRTSAHEAQDWSDLSRIMGWQLLQLG